MSFGCTVAGHRAGADQVYNSGYYFSACRRCGRPLVRSAAGDWGIVPPGHRVIWKAGRHSHSLEADYTGALPIVQEEASLPASRSLRVASGRSLVRMKPSRSAAGSARAIAVEEESDDYPYPRLLLMAVMLGAGLKMLLGFAAGR